MAKGNNIHDEIKEQSKKLKDLSFQIKSNTYGAITGFQS